MLIFGGETTFFWRLTHFFFSHVRTDYLSLHLISLLSFLLFLANLISQMQLRSPSSSLASALASVPSGGVFTVSVAESDR